MRDSNTEYDLSRKSRPTVIVPYQRRWIEEFEASARRLRSIVGDQVLRIDHIGSTAVTGLGAKDIVDIQFTVSDLESLQELEDRMTQSHFVFRVDVRSDNFLGSDNGDPREWRKAYFREPSGEKRTHIHVRELGRRNQQYALLFRDFLRANDNTRRAYELVKVRLSEVFPECIDGYLYIKDPLMDIIFEGAKVWARQEEWAPADDHF